MPRPIFRFALFFAALFVGGGAAMTVAAAEKGGDGVEVEGRPVVLLELFTSQGCYSCPPAEELLAEEYARPDGFLPVEFYADNWDDLITAQEYARRDDVLPLELHVDYWDDLIYGLAGSWQDPFSQNFFSRRQFAYNRRLRGKGTGWTPQFVIHGKSDSVGARQEQIDAAIAKVKNDADDGAAKWRFRFDADDEGKWRASIGGTMPPGVRLFFAVFQKRAITEVPSGENKGKTLTNTNVVLLMNSRSLDDGRELSLPKLKPGEGCAVWAQNGDNGNILAAAKCPQQQPSSSS